MFGIGRILGRLQSGAIQTVASLLQSPRDLSRPLATRRKLIQTLFGRAANLFMVAVAAMICGAAAWFRGGNWITGTVAALEVSLLLTRCLVMLAYNRRENAGLVANPDSWLVGFGLLAVASSISWGALCLVALASSRDSLLYVIPILATVGTAGAVAARNSGVPRLAKTQLVCSLAPICGGCLLTDDQGFRLLLLLVPAMAVGLTIFIAERHEQLVDFIETQIELARLSQTDALTQLPNRRALDLAIEDAATAEFALLMMDIDNFKAFNDRHGHLVGDMMLRNVAMVLQQNLRDDGAVVARYGGEEFVILLPDKDAIGAARIGERLRQVVASVCCDPHDGKPVTISAGCAIFRIGDDPRVVVREADEALYGAKRSGRNRINIAQQSFVGLDAA